MIAKVKQGGLGVYAGIEGLSQLLVEESVVGYAYAVSDPAGTLVALIILGLGVSALTGVADLRDR